jgi:hypothetical protein
MLQRHSLTTEFKTNQNITVAFTETYTCKQTARQDARQTLTQPEQEAFIEAI